MVFTKINQKRLEKALSENEWVHDICTHGKNHEDLDLLESFLHYSVGLKEISITDISELIYFVKNIWLPF